MTKDILVPVDGSDRSLEALRYTIDAFPDGSVTAYHVIQPPGAGDLGAFAGMTGDLPNEDAVLERSEEILGDARSVGDERGVTIQTTRGRGRPDKAILEEVEGAEYDLVVIGSHGRDGVARVLLGSVAEKVVRRSPIPVLVYRPDE